MRIILLSDLHFWRYDAHPARLMNKRMVGMLALAAGRARRFRLDRWRSVVDRVLSLRPDHVVIAGDLTTTALESEFADAHAALSLLGLGDEQLTVIPGNHDRYTAEAARSRRFEAHFGRFMGDRRFPWLKRIEERTVILGLDPTRPHLSARGYLPPAQMMEASRLVGTLASGTRLIVACHYPLGAPDARGERELWSKRLENAEEVADWLRGVGPHVYCCGHVHQAWAYRPRGMNGQVVLNPGPPLMAEPPNGPAPGFLEIELRGGETSVVRHEWTTAGWSATWWPIAVG